MAETQVNTNQILFESTKSGTRTLDDYLESCERPGKALFDLIAVLFDSNGSLLITTDAPGTPINGRAVGPTTPSTGNFTSITATTGTVNGAAIATTTGVQTLTNKSIVKPEIFGDATGYAATVRDPSNPTGSNIALVGNGGTTPNKYIRAVDGFFDILSSDYTRFLITLNDDGRLGISRRPSSVIDSQGPTAQAFFRLVNTTSSEDAIISAGSSGFITGATMFGPSTNTPVGLMSNSVERMRFTTTGALAINGAANVGTSGHVLTSQGSGSPPVWAAPAGSGNNISTFYQFV